jgi:hypothetical protein
MEEIELIVEGLGWEETYTYGIIVDHVGYYIGCEWSGVKQSAEVAMAELTAHGISPNECLVCTHEEAEVVRLKRQAEGYYDDMDIHA